jgi:hypothetical protein
MYLIVWSCKGTDRELAHTFLEILVSVLLITVQSEFLSLFLHIFKNCG